MKANTLWINKQTKLKVLVLRAGSKRIEITDENGNHKSLSRVYFLANYESFD